MSMRISFLTILLLLLISPNARSQDPGQQLHLSVDRPGISDYPTIVPQGWLQFEMGLEYFQREDHRALFLPTLLVRTAITRGVEVRLTNRFLRIDSAANSPENEHYYYGAIEVKAVLLREKGWMPATSAMGGFSLTPETTRKLNGPIWGNYVLLLFENNLHDKVVLNYNTGLTWNRSEGASSLMYSMAVEWELSTKHAVFVEQSTFFNEREKNDYWVNLGYTHLAAHHSQIDFSGGLNLNGGSNDFFFAIGYSTRIPLKPNPDN